MTSPVLFSAIFKRNHPLPNNGVLFSVILSLPPPLSRQPLSPRFPCLKLSTSSSVCNSTSHEDVQVAYDFSPVLKVCRDGHVERLAGLETVPPGIYSVINVQSKDVVISEDQAISARIFLPKITNPHLKLPVLVYFHGGNFCFGSAFSPAYHDLLNSVTSQANVIGVSVKKIRQKPRIWHYVDRLCVKSIIENK